MRIFSALGALLALTFLSGCDSLSDAASSVREKLAAREEPRTRTYAADQRATFEAVRVAAEQMGYRILRARATEGAIDAVNGVSTDDSLRSARQISMKVRLRATLDGGTEVSVALDEIVEADSVGHAGQGTSAPLRGTPQYDVFLRRVQQALDAQAAAKKG